jgi:hypothetical protein
MDKEEEEGNKAFEWGEAEQKAFETLRDCLITPPFFSFPDCEKEFLIFTDASIYGIGAVLSQIQNEEVVLRRTMLKKFFIWTHCNPTGREP